jgi:hypothetical protein
VTRVDDSAICRRPAYRPLSGRRTFWDGSEKDEIWRDMRKRQATGVYLCSVCPTLAACQRFLAEMDRRSEIVDGVVAGEVRTWRRSYHKR